MWFECGCCFVHVPTPSILTLRNDSNIVSFFLSFSAYFLKRDMKKLIYNISILIGDRYGAKR